MEIDAEMQQEWWHRFTETLQIQHRNSRYHRNTTAGHVRDRPLRGMNNQKPPGITAALQDRGASSYPPPPTQACGAVGPYVDRRRFCPSPLFPPCIRRGHTVLCPPRGGSTVSEYRTEVLQRSNELARGLAGRESTLVGAYRRWSVLQAPHRLCPVSGVSPFPRLMCRGFCAGDRRDDWGM
jgi:hypothetical protein